MDADFSIELGNEDPVLDLPWSDPAGKLAYVDLKRRPELMAEIKEAATYPELGEFLRVLNSPPSMVETAKCDAWVTTELSVEEEIYNASDKFGSYVDIVFCSAETRGSLASHEQIARKLLELLRRTPETPSAAEVCVRRCFFRTDGDGEGGIQEGFYFTLYVSGYGKDDSSARQNWGVGLKLVGNAMVQLSQAG